MRDVASSDYLDTVADLNENTNEEVDENLDDILLPILDLPKVTINLSNKQGRQHLFERRTKKFKEQIFNGSISTMKNHLFII